MGGSHNSDVLVENQHILPLLGLGPCSFSLMEHFFQCVCLSMSIFSKGQRPAGRFWSWGCHTGDGVEQEENGKRILTNELDYTVCLDAGHVI